MNVREKMKGEERQRELLILALLAENGPLMWGEIVCALGLGEAIGVSPNTGKIMFKRTAPTWPFRQAHDRLAVRKAVEHLHGDNKFNGRWRVTIDGLVELERERRPDALKGARWYVAINRPSTSRPVLAMTTPGGPTPAHVIVTIGPNAERADYDRLRANEIVNPGPLTKLFNRDEFNWTAETFANAQWWGHVTAEAVPDWLRAEFEREHLRPKPRPESRYENEARRAVEVLASSYYGLGLATNHRGGRKAVIAYEERFASTARIAAEVYDRIGRIARGEYVPDTTIRFEPCSASAALDPTADAEDMEQLGGAEQDDGDRVGVGDLGRERRDQHGGENQDRDDDGEHGEPPGASVST